MYGRLLRLDYGNPKNWGPDKCEQYQTNLTDCPTWLKLLEKYIHTNLVCFLEDNKLHYKSQGGFRKNRSITQTVYELVNEVANAKNDSKFSLAIYLDIAKAFDSINHDYLLRKLHMIGIREMYLKWLKSYMTDRKQIVLNENYESTEHKVSCGVPQGSILGPLLLIIYMNDLSKLSLTSNVLLFADDTVLYYSNKCVKTLYNTVHLLPLKLRREIALTKIMFSQGQDNQGLRLRELSTRAHDGPVMKVLKPTSSKYMKSVAYRGPTSWNSLKPELRCLRDKSDAVKSYFWEAYKTQNIG